MVITQTSFECANILSTYGYSTVYILYIIGSMSNLKGANRQVCIFSAHNWWATPEVSLLLPYQQSAKVFLNFLQKGGEDNVLL